MLFYALLSINQTARIYCCSQRSTERGTGSSLMQKMFHLRSAGVSALLQVALPKAG